MKKIIMWLKYIWFYQANEHGYFVMVERNAREAMVGQEVGIYAFKTVGEAKHFINDDVPKSQRDHCVLLQRVKTFKLKKEDK